MIKMPRPKGSKNKKTAATNTMEINISIESLDEQIKTTEAEIESMTAALKDKKSELKALIKSKDQAEKIAAEKKVEEDKIRILDDVAASGKSVDEILEMLK
jgi:DNA polymerase II small subunit/DNA polymerase delta subunit B